MNFGNDERGFDPTKRALANGLRDEFTKAAVGIIKAKGPGSVETALSRLPRRG